MSILDWSDANLRSNPHKRLLELFVCTDEDLTMELSAVGAVGRHSCMWEWEAQTAIQQQVKKMRRDHHLVRLGFDGDVLGAVMAAQEIEKADYYHLVVGAIAVPFRSQYAGMLGDEMIEDMFARIGERCVEVGGSADVQVSAEAHKSNVNSQRLMKRHGFHLIGQKPDQPDYEEWLRPALEVPQPPLFDG